MRRHCLAALAAALIVLPQAGRALAQEESPPTQAPPKKAPPQAPAAPPAPSPEEQAAFAAFDRGAQADAARKHDVARTHYLQALELSQKLWPKDEARRSGWQGGVWRAIAWSWAWQGNGDEFRAAGRQALSLLVTAGGAPAEELRVEQACYHCLGLQKDAPAKIAFLEAWRADLLGLIPDPPPDKSAVYNRLQKQVGQTWHEVAYVQQSVKDFKSAKATLERAIRYRWGIGDLMGAGWSSQNRFWVLLQLNEDDEAGAQLCHTWGLLHAGIGLDIEASLDEALVTWLQQRVDAGEHARAAQLLSALRRTGTLAKGGLTTFTAARALRIELELRLAAKETQGEQLDAIGRALLAAGEREGDASAAFYGAQLLGRLALEAPGDGAVAQQQARAAIAAAEALGDPDRQARGRLLLARALEAGGDAAAAEAAIRAVWTAHAAPDTDPYFRERARQAGFGLAQRAGNAEWQKRYEPVVQPPRLRPVAGHTWLGVDIPLFWRNVAEAGGDGGVLTITRRGNRYYLRSPFVTGTQVIESGWRLRYVNANGILLAFQGPAVAVIGRRDTPTAPPAAGGTVKLGKAGLDLAALRGPRLPMLAPRAVLRDGETAFVNRFLRIHR